MRINCGIDPKTLSDEHLFAEQRELKMLPSYFRDHGFSSYGRVPNHFKLGEGYILFFAYRPKYTLDRYNKVFEECIERGYNIQYEGWRWNVYGEDNRFLDFKEDDVCTRALIERISQKTSTSPKKSFHYYHKPISKEEVIRKLLENS